MAKSKEKPVIEGMERFNRVKPLTNVLFTAVFIFTAIMSIIPLILVFMISITDRGSIQLNGYSFFPETISTEAWSIVWTLRDPIIQAGLVSVLVTVVGTVLGLFLNSAMGYVISRQSFKFRKFYTWLIFIPMVFNGGLVSSYLVMTQVLRLNNSIWALILPMLVQSFYVIVLRTFFTSTIPDSLVESAKIDGASQFRVFFQIVLPISLPALATVSIFLSFAYWNDWFLGLMYITDTAKYPLQYFLVQMDREVQFILQNANLIGGSASMQAADIPQEGFKMAVVIVTVVPIACTYPFFQKYFVSGLTVGAVKG